MTDITNPALDARWAQLRRPFEPNQIGKLPRVTCGDCRNSRTKACTNHQKSRCNVCGNWITSAHMHLDYVGHAAVTQRLLEVDPNWFWSPQGRDADGLPKFDDYGGLWITLYLPGLNAAKHGYGAAEGKTGPDARKEIIGDALRNAAMRYGVGLDLWSKEDLVVPDVPAQEPAAARGRDQASVTQIRDWQAEAAACTTDAEIDALATQCQTAGAFVGDTYDTLVARKRTIRGGAVAESA